MFIIGLMKRCVITAPAIAALLLVQGTPSFAVSLTGTATIVGGDCSGVTGSYFQMWSSTIGKLANFASACADTSVNPLMGTTGLVLGSFQNNGVAVPGTCVANVGGNGSTAIVSSFNFFGNNVYLSTNAEDNQACLPNVAPSFDSDLAGNVTGNIQAWDVFWNGNTFNQGAPKPDGTFPSLGTEGTVTLSGTYNNTTGAYTAAWRSLIVGGAFNGFTGHWQLSGMLPAGQISSATPTNTPTPTDTPVPGVTNTPTDTPVPGATSTPTDTPVPGATSTPTDTPMPTDTPTPTATGSGSSSSSGGCGGMIDPGSSGGPTSPGNAMAVVLSLAFPFLWNLGRKGYRYCVR